MEDGALILIVIRPVESTEFAGNIPMPTTNKEEIILVQTVATHVYIRVII